MDFLGHVVPYVVSVIPEFDGLVSRSRWATRVSACTYLCIWLVGHYNQIHKYVHALTLVAHLHLAASPSNSQTTESTYETTWPRKFIHGFTLQIILDEVEYQSKSSKMSCSLQQCPTNEIHKYVHVPTLVAHLDLETSPSNPGITESTYGMTCPRKSIHGFTLKIILDQVECQSSPSNSGTTKSTYGTMCLRNSIHGFTVKMILDQVESQSKSSKMSCSMYNVLVIAGTNTYMR